MALATLLGLVQQFSCGAILLDPRGQPISWNQHAAPFVKQATKKLHESQERRQAPQPEKLIVLEQDSGRLVLGKRFAFKEKTGNAASMLLLLDLKSTWVPDEHVLKTAFGLTGAECLLTQGLAEGKSLQEIAARSKKSIGTVRMQLKSVLGKTHTRRQAELVSLLGRLAIFSG